MNKQASKISAIEAADNKLIVELMAQREAGTLSTAGYMRLDSLLCKDWSEYDDDDNTDVDNTPYHKEDY